MGGMTASETRFIEVLSELFSAKGLPLLAMTLQTVVDDGYGIVFSSYLNLFAREAGKLVSAVIENAHRFGGVVTVSLQLPARLSPGSDGVARLYLREPARTPKSSGQKCTLLLRRECLVCD